MKEPTEEEVKRLWEWCGLKEMECHTELMIGGNDSGVAWFYPEATNSYIFLSFNVPPIDLNNLFKWAVPKVNSLGWGVGLMPCGPITNPLWYGDTFNIWKEVHYRESNPKMDDPALALFWALDKVREGE